MADTPTLENLELAAKSIDSIDMTALLRRNLGEESLEKEFGPRLERIQQIRAFATRYAPHVHNDFVNPVRSIFQQIAQGMDAQAKRPASEYINQKANFIQTIDQQITELSRHDPPFVAAAVHERGFLEDEGIRREYQKTIEQLRTETAATLKTVKDEADKAIAGAKTLAEEIETRARRTAAKISVQEAQKQFTDASANLDQKVKVWGVVVTASIILVVTVAFALMNWTLPNPEKWPDAVYHAVLRLVVLSALGAATTVCVRILRAHMHMAEKNRHRVRVANSVESFVNSAIDPQQRDLILAKLVESIVDFGDSGLIKHEMEDVSPTMSGEVIGRILAGLSAKR
jgi:hypothetical protein